MSFRKGSTQHQDNGLSNGRSTRRKFLQQAGAAGAVLLTPMVAQPFLAKTRAASDVFTIVSHRVHEQVTTGTRGGAGVDLIGPFLQERGINRIDWITLAIQPVHDRLFRESALPTTNVDLGFILNSYTYPRVANLFEPLTAYQERNPIEDIEDFFEPMRDTFTVNGQLFAIPMRATTTMLHYNREIFEERGISGPPTSMEELVEFARRLTYTRANGEKVYGFAVQGLQSEIYLPLLDLARAWGDGDYITADYEVVCHKPPMVQALTMLRDLFQEGVLPPNFNALSTTDETRMVQNGRVAMSIHGSNYYWTFNDEANSAVAGKMDIANIPVSEGIRDRYEVAPTKTEFWAMAIPRNAQRKDLSWEVIRHLSSKENTLIMALNGNGPCRASTYDAEAYRREIPYADLEQRVLKVSRPPFPLLEGTSRIVDIIGREAHLAISGAKSPQSAMDDAAEQISRLLA